MHNVLGSIPLWQLSNNKLGLPALLTLVQFSSRESLNQFAQLIEESHPSIVELANDIQANGLINPITVQWNEGNVYTILDGYRRCLATTYLFCLRWSSIPGLPVGWPSCTIAGFTIYPEQVAPL